jgi:hypothetical protein
VEVSRGRIRKHCIQFGSVVEIERAPRDPQCY